MDGRSLYSFPAHRGVTREVAGPPPPAFSGSFANLCKLFWILKYICFWTRKIPTQKFKKNSNFLADFFFIFFFTCSFTTTLVSNFGYTDAINPSLNPPSPSAQSLNTWKYTAQALKYILLFAFLPWLCIWSACLRRRRGGGKQGTWRYELSRRVPRWPSGTQYPSWDVSPSVVVIWDVQNLEIKFKFAGKVGMLQRDGNYHWKDVCFIFRMAISLFSCRTYSLHMTGYTGSRDYVGNLWSPWRTPHWSQHPTEKYDPDPVVAELRVRCTEHPNRTRNERVGVSVTTGSGSSFSVGDGEQCGVLHGDYRFPT